MTTPQQWPTGRHAQAGTPSSTTESMAAVYAPPAAQPQIPQQWTPPGAYPTQQAPQQPAPKKWRKWPFVVGGIVVLLVIIGLISGPGTTSTATVPTAAAPTAAPVPAGPSQADIDRAQKQLDDINRQIEQRKAELSNTPAAPAVPAAPAAPAPAASGPASTVSDGKYQVGTDMAAGRYKTAGPSGSGALDMCYVARNRNDSGEFGAIIANQLVQGPSSVTVKKGEFAEFSGGCTWTKQ